MKNIELGPNISELFRAVTATGKTMYDGNIRFVGSGKAAIGLILSYLRFKGILKNKMNQINNCLMDIHQILSKSLAHPIANP